MLGNILSGITSLASGLFGANRAEKAADDQARLQRQFAQNAIQWKVADARKAGVHPLYALGAQTTSYQPVSVGDPLPGALHDMGQDISRAVAATSPESVRTGTLAQLAVERAGLENELLRTQIGKLKAPAVGPGFPGDETIIDGQGNALIKKNPLPMVRTRPGSEFKEPGAVPDVGWAKTPTGFVPIPSLDVKQRIEDNLPHEWSHYFRNNILPALPFGAGRMSPPFPARPGERWVYEAGEYRLKPVKPRGSFRGYLNFN